MMYYIIYSVCLLFVISLVVLKSKKILGLKKHIKIDDIYIYGMLYSILFDGKERMDSYTKIRLSIENKKAKPYIELLLRNRKVKLEHMSSRIDGVRYIALLSVIDDKDNGIMVIPVYIEIVDKVAYITIDDVYVCLNNKLESATNFNLLSNDVNEIVKLDALDDSVSMTINDRTIEIYGDSDYNIISKYELGVKQW